MNMAESQFRRASEAVEGVYFKGRSSQIERANGTNEHAAYERAIAP